MIESGERTPANQRTDAVHQSAYHRQLFAAVYEWEKLWDEAVEMAGDAKCAVDLGLDQMGHFGPRGVSLVVERLLSASERTLTRVVELGSGLGGALRHAARELRARSVHARLVGVELVADHCEVAGVVGRTIGDTGPLVLCADAARLPFRSESIDAVFAAGSASHFSSMRSVLAECGRVLCPRGVLVMTEEVSLRPRAAPTPGDAFVENHPPDVFHAATPEQRYAELTAAGLTVERVDPLVDWAAPLLRQRAQALRFMGACAKQMFGADAYQRMFATLTSAAEEYERGSVAPVLIVARRAE